MSSTADVVICGAGISGIATAYHLAVTYGVKNIVIVDERPPLSLTSDKSSEAYRNWWPDEMMVRLMNRSIDWLERWAVESSNRFLLNRRGYVYFTANPGSVAHFRQSAQMAAEAGAGEVRTHVDRYPGGEVRACPQRIGERSRGQHMAQRTKHRSGATHAAGERAGGGARCHCISLDQRDAARGERSEIR